MSALNQHFLVFSARNLGYVLLIRCGNFTIILGCFFFFFHTAAVLRDFVWKRLLFLLNSTKLNTAENKPLQRFMFSDAHPIQRRKTPSLYLRCFRKTRARKMSWSETGQITQPTGRGRCGGNPGKAQMRKMCVDFVNGFSKGIIII